MRFQNIFYETAFDISPSFKSVPYFNVLFHVICKHRTILSHTWTRQILHERLRIDLSKRRIYG